MFETLLSRSRDKTKDISNAVVVHVRVSRGSKPPRDEGGGTPTSVPHFALRLCRRSFSLSVQRRARMKAGSMRSLARVGARNPNKTYMGRIIREARQLMKPLMHDLSEVHCTSDTSSSDEFLESVALRERNEGQLRPLSSAFIARASNSSRLSSTRLGKEAVIPIPSVRMSPATRAAFVLHRQLGERRRQTLQPPKHGPHVRNSAWNEDICDCKMG